MTIFTIGYEGASPDAFLRRLTEAGVCVVVDVRDLPLSRKPGFSKTALSASLERSGVGYRHVRDLGCPKPIRDRYRADGDWDSYTEAYMEHLRGQQPALAELGRLCATAPAALLCYEADPNQCHRTYVARAVARLTDGIVAHIGAGGITQELAIVDG
jgi:uncharacterized protein (DUF488 family)